MTKQQLIKQGQDMATAVCQFVEVAAFRAGKSGQANILAQEKLSEASNKLAQSIYAILNTVGVVAAKLPVASKPSFLPPEEEAKEDAMVMQELETTLQAVTEAHTLLKEQSEDLKVVEGRSPLLDTKMRLPKEPENIEKGLVLASRSVTSATKELVSTAIAAEKERIQTSEGRPRLSRASSRDHIIVSAQKVSAVTQQLVELAKGKPEEDVIVSCAKSVAAAAAQLVTASNSFASPAYLQRLSEAAKAVLFCTYASYLYLTRLRYQLLNSFLLPDPHLLMMRKKKKMSLLQEV
jgi:hypothetical protein